MSQSLHATTPFPNRLLDDVLPRLKDTEWRLLCVIVRQTLGWQSKDGRHRKTSDWITQAQLVKKTGRERAALSRALDSLVSHRYIEVRNEKGRLLQTPQERRQCKGRLFYTLREKSEYQAPRSDSLLNNFPAKSESHRVSKANTTKETLTKESNTKALHQKFLDHLAAEVYSREMAEAGSKVAQSILLSEEPEYSEAAKSFVSLFQQLSQEAKNRKPDIYLNTENVERLEQLLASHFALNWTPILQTFFESDADYIARRNHSLGAFLNSCHIFLLRHPSVTAQRRF